MIDLKEMEKIDYHDYYEGVVKLMEVYNHITLAHNLLETYFEEYPEQGKYEALTKIQSPPTQKSMWHPTVRHTLNRHYNSLCEVRQRSPRQEKLRWK